jgi:cytidyltransferase-like protein
MNKQDIFKTVKIKLPYFKIITIDTAVKTVKDYHALGYKVVLTTGVYDLFHYKHAESLRYIASLGDKLIIALPTDELIMKVAKKGIQDKNISGPVVGYEDRAKLLAHFDFVDLIFPKTGNKLELLKNIKPDILVQSITSGPGLVDEIISFLPEIEIIKDDHNLFIKIDNKNCEIIFIDDIINGKTKIIPFKKAKHLSIFWERTKFDSNKFHGSLIKRRILEKFISGNNK